MIVAFAAEIARFKEPGGNVINLAGAILAVVYIGGLATFLIQLRIAFGLAALFSLIVVAKAGDTGAFVIGRMIGRTKMSPGISPGKTIEGLIGGLLCGLLAAWFWFKVVIPIAASKTWLIEDTIMKTPTYGWVLFGLGVAGAGVLGDLAESRDNFSQAQKLEEEKQYEAAMETYGKVIQQDDNYTAAQGKIDECSIYAVLYKVTKGEAGIDEYLDGTNIMTSDKVIARAQLPDGSDKSSFTEFRLPFIYTEEPDYDKYDYKLAVVFASSKEGDYYRGAVGSTLIVDKTEVVCEPYMEEK